MAAELRFRAMGSDAHVVVTGGRRGLLEVAQRRIDDLEQKWSRFLPDSEITALNEHAGSLVPVSRDTIELVTRSLDAYLLSDGWFDPTVYGALLRAGYDRTLDAVRGDPRRGRSTLQTGAERILVAADAVALPIGTGFDPGGIGKGLAADIVVDELVAEGAAGVCISLGGDVPRERCESGRHRVEHRDRASAPHDPARDARPLRGRGRDVDDAVPAMGGRRRRPGTTSSTRRPVSRPRRTAPFVSVVDRSRVGSRSDGQGVAPAPRHRSGRRALGPGERALRRPRRARRTHARLRRIRTAPSPRTGSILEAVG